MTTPGLEAILENERKVNVRDESIDTRASLPRLCWRLSITETVPPISLPKGSQWRSEGVVRLVVAGKRPVRSTIVVICSESVLDSGRIGWTRNRKSLSLDNLFPARGRTARAGEPPRRWLVPRRMHKEAVVKSLNTGVLICALVLAMAVGASLSAWPADGGDTVRDKERAAKGWHTPLVISAADFKPDGNGPDDFFFNLEGHFEGEGIIIRLHAPAYLPHGATIHQLSASVYDNDDECDSPDIRVFLRRARFSDGTWYSMGLAQTSGASASVQQISDTSITNSLIDNVDFVYYVYVSMCDASHELMAVKIYYSE